MFSRYTSIWEGVRHYLGGAGGGAVAFHGAGGHGVRPEQRPSSGSTGCRAWPQQRVLLGWCTQLDRVVYSGAGERRMWPM